MKTKKFFNVLALIMMMPAMLLTTACSSDDDSIINNETPAKKGYTIPVTINVTRQGDDATRAAYNGTSLGFSAGDKLFVGGYNDALGNITGTLTWKEGTTFSGTITTQNEYSGSANEIFSGLNTKFAHLLPAGYKDYGYITITENNGYDDVCGLDYTKAIVTSTTSETTKALAVEQFSNEYSQEYSNGFDLSPQNAILNFDITDLTPSTNVEVVLTVPAGSVPSLSSPYNITKQVTTDDSGHATFAVGVHAYALDANRDLKDFVLTVGGKTITITSSSKTLVRGHIYKITKSGASHVDARMTGTFTEESVSE